MKPEDKLRDTRDRLQKDSRYMRRFRAKYIRFARRWVDEDKSRIDKLAERILELGMYSGKPKCPSARRCIRYSILRTWFKADGPHDHFGWFKWTSKHGWQTYRWMPNVQGLAGVA